MSRAEDGGDWRERDEVYREKLAMAESIDDCMCLGALFDAAVYAYASALHILCDRRLTAERVAEALGMEPHYARQSLARLGLLPKEPQP